jgi:hypothetical protein
MGRGFGSSLFVSGWKSEWQGGTGRVDEMEVGLREVSLIGVDG